MILFLASERIVMKFGTNSLTNNGKLNYEVIQKIADSVDLLYRLGKKPVIVTSGAVAAGMELNGLDLRPKNTDQLQELSAEGSRHLANLYANAFEKYGIRTMYIPITSHSFGTQEEIENIRKMINRSWQNRKITIWNTNDALTNEQLVKITKNGFYDNDPLAVALAKCCHADLLLFFTDKGNMGTGGGSSKGNAIEDAKDAGIKVEVRGISYLDKFS